MNLVLLAAALPACLSSGYLMVLTLLSGPARVAQPRSRQLRFDVFVPAHNEAEVIERTIASLRRIDWPQDRFRIRVIADNCTDATAVLARAAGAGVLVRDDTARRGKGYALAHAFAASRDEGWADAVVVVDADAEVSANLLSAFAQRLEGGSIHAVQAHYGVLNPMASWRTRLITIAKGSFHIVRSRARERLGLSCGIRGNGWCVTHELLRQVPYNAFSLTEDLEYGIDIGLAGYRVAYADEAHSDAEMVTSERVAVKQRRRWEEGRFELIRSRTLPLLLAAARRRDPVCLDLALDLLVLPLSYVAINIIAFALLAVLALYLQWASSAWLALAAASCAAVGLYVLRGWQLSGVGRRGLLDLLRAPGFLLWKVLVMLSPRKGDGWIRTDREK